MSKQNEQKEKMKKVHTARLAGLKTRRRKKNGVASASP
jgi:hypothetical protein